MLIVLLVVTAGMMMFGRWQPGAMVLTGVDVAGHWAWLRSPLLDHDLVFGNDYEGVMQPSVFEMHREPLAETGHQPNPFPIGVAVALFPLVLVTHELRLHTSLLDQWPADGFSQPYALAAHWSLWMWGAIGLFLTHAWLRRRCSPNVSLMAALLTWLATNALYYNFPLILNNHSLALFAMPLFLLMWDRWEEKPTWMHAGGAGIACGLLFLVRWQLVLWPAVFWLTSAPWKHHDRMRTLWILPVAGVLVALPQFIGWRIIYGHWLLMPQGGSYVHWLRPMIHLMLFSTERGWITWTPIVAIGLVGIGMGWKRDVPLTIRIIIGLLLQFYISSVVTDWHGRWGFSTRRLAHATPLIAWGVAVVLSKVTRDQLRPLITASTVLALLALWNFLFLYQQYHHLIPYHRPLTFHELVGDKLHIAASRERRLCVMNVMGFIDLARQALVAGERQGAVEDLQEAETWMARGWDADPMHEDNYLASAMLAAEWGDMNGAIGVYQRCLEDLDVDRYQILTSIGVCHFYMNQVPQAVAYARQALAIKPDFDVALGLLDDAADGRRDHPHELFFY